jgi:hypothetical protein
MAILELIVGTYAVVVLGVSAFVWIAYRPDPYPPEAAQAPPSLGEHFSTAPIDDLDTSVDWHRYEYEMRKQT